MPWVWQLYEVEKKLKKYEGMLSSMTPEVKIYRA
jgi:hypothetical protein